MVIVSTTTKPVSIIVVISRTPAIVCRISHFKQARATLVLDLESSSLCCYLALVERLLDQWGILKHFPQSRSITHWSRDKQQSSNIILIEGAIWFGYNDIFSSLFPDNCWCPCKTFDKSYVGVDITKNIPREKFNATWRLFCIGPKSSTY